MLPRSVFSKRKRALLFKSNSAVTTPLWQLKQTTFSWPFRNWHPKATVPLSTTTSAQLLSSQTHSPQSYPHLTGNLKKLNCLKIFAKQASRVITSLLTATESTIVTQSRQVMHCRHLEKISSPTLGNLRDFVAVFYRRHVKHQQINGQGKPKIREICFSPSNQQLMDFLDELQRLQKDAFGIAAHAIIEHFIDAKCHHNRKHLWTSFTWRMAGIKRLLHALKKRWSWRSGKPLMSCSWTQWTSMPLKPELSQPATIKTPAVSWNDKKIKLRKQKTFLEPTSRHDHHQCASWKWFRSDHVPERAA